MVAPVVTKTATELWNGLGPWSRADNDSTSWHLLLLCEAICKPLDYVENLARDDSQGNLGWSSLLDANRVPAEAVDWLGQTVGVAIPPGTALADARLYVKATGGFNRGSLASLKGAPIPYLTGTKKVVVRERTTSAYHLTVYTYTAETTDSAAVLAALLAQKPAGLILTYIDSAGPTIDQLVGTINAQVHTINDYITVVP